MSDEQRESGDDEGSLKDINEVVPKEVLSDKSIVVKPVPALVLEIINKWGFNMLDSGYFPKQERDFPVLDGQIAVLSKNIQPEEFLAGLERSYNLLTWGFLKSGDDSPIKEVYPVLWDRMLREKSAARDKIFLLGNLGSLASTTKKFDFVLPLNYFGGVYDIPRIPQYTFRYQDRSEARMEDMIVQCTGSVFAAPYKIGQDYQPFRLCRVMTMSARRRFGTRTLSFHTLSSKSENLLTPQHTILKPQIDLLTQGDPFKLKGGYSEVMLPLNGMYKVSDAVASGYDGLIGGMAVQFLEEDTYRIQDYAFEGDDVHRSLKPLHKRIVDENEARDILNGKIRGLIG